MNSVLLVLALVLVLLRSKVAVARWWYECRIVITVRPQRRRTLAIGLLVVGTFKVLAKRLLMVLRWLLLRVGLPKMLRLEGWKVLLSVLCRSAPACPLVVVVARVILIEVVLALEKISRMRTRVPSLGRSTI
mgnify:CR=1 FL=1